MDLIKRQLVYEIWHKSTRLNGEMFTADLNQGHRLNDDPGSEILLKFN